MDQVSERINESPFKTINISENLKTDWKTQKKNQLKK